MKLDDAYQGWGQENKTLYINTRQKFRKVWWLIPTNKPCEYYTLPVLGRALQQANADKGDKVQAASVMVHVLNYAHQQEPDLNPAPTFTHTDIVNFEGTKPSKMVQAMEEHEAAANTQQPTPITQSEAPLVKVKPAAEAKREGVLARRTGTPPKSVVQLDAETLKPIKVWKSCNAAQNGLGIKNVQRAISRCGISGGFYWCRPGDEETFKPADKRTHNGGRKAKAPARGQVPGSNKPFTDEEKELHSKVFDDARGHDARGQSPDREPVKVQSPGIERTAVAEAQQEFEEEIVNHVEGVLRNCTQDELIAELRRRSWKGVLHITQTIEL